MQNSFLQQAFFGTGYVAAGQPRMKIEDTPSDPQMLLTVRSLAEQNGVTEQLKADNQMEWVRQMNACKAQAEDIANQSADWCGNPPDFRTITSENRGIYSYPGDCHISDVGHWLAMTASFWLF